MEVLFYTAVQGLIFSFFSNICPARNSYFLSRPLRFMLRLLLEGVRSSHPIAPTLSKCISALYWIESQWHLLKVSMSCTGCACEITSLGPCSALEPRRVPSRCLAGYIAVDIGSRAFQKTSARHQVPAAPSRAMSGSGLIRDQEKQPAMLPYLPILSHAKGDSPAVSAENFTVVIRNLGTLLRATQ